MLRGTLLVFATLALLWIRRPDQFTHPYLWNEEGRIFLLGFVTDGWRSLFASAAGYQALAAKLVLLPTFAFGIEQAPRLAMLGAVAVTLGTVLAIAFAPTHLRYPSLAALAPLAIPIGVEPYAIALMSFWWAGLLLVLALLWRQERLGWRLFLIAFGGLSSPIVIPLSALFALRWWFERTRANLAATALAVAIAVVQLANLAAAPRLAATPVPTPSPLLFVGKFVGYFFAPDTARVPGQGDALAIAVGLVALVGLAGLAFAFRRRLGPPFFLLALAALLLAGVNVVRVDLAQAYPVLTTPRYFFYPFILIAWLMLWLAHQGGSACRVVVAVLFAGILWQSAPDWRARHAPIDWRNELAKCARAETYDLPFHRTGRMEELWRIKLTGAQCRALLG